MSGLGALALAAALLVARAAAAGSPRPRRCPEGHDPWQASGCAAASEEGAVLLQAGYGVSTRTEQRRAAAAAVPADASARPARSVPARASDATSSAARAFAAAPAGGGGRLARAVPARRGDDASPRPASPSALQAVRQWLRGAPLVSLRELGRKPGDWLGDLFDSGEAGGSGSVTEVWSASSSDWALLAASIVACMALDFFAFRKAPSSAPPGAWSDRDAAEATEEKLAKEHGSHGQASSPLSADSPEPEPENAERSASAGSKTREDLFALLCWVLCGMAFNGVIFWKRGAEAGVHWCCGYVLEWLLSFDNIFVFYLIFQTYKVPRELLHRALFVGIAGAVVLRIFFFVALSKLLHVVHWVRFIFGAILVYSGVQAAREEDDDANPADSMAMRAFQALFGDRVRSEYDIQGKRLFVTEGQRTYATMLVPVIFCLEATDVVFAIDSVSAKVAQIPDVYIAFSSSAMAIFGLRAMFFVVQDLVDMFDLLKYGLCFILVFIGVELLVSDFVHLPIHVVLVVILSVFVVCIFGPATKRALIPAASPSEARLTPAG